MKFLLLVLFLSSCATPETVYIEKIRYVDIETYKTWGSTQLVPIGVRPLPTQQEIDSNPLWQDGQPDKAYDERRRDNLKKHPGN